MSEHLQLRIHGAAHLPTLVYLPGLHGDWTLAVGFRLALARRVRLVEITYPRTLTWSLQDYARAVEAALLENGIARGWLLGESFSSQVAWAMAEAGTGEMNFHIEGVILAGGFVRHPLRWGVWLTRVANASLPLFCLRGCLSAFETYAKFRFRHAPETRAGICQFVRNRGNKLDRAALRRRLRLIAENDLRPVARRTTLPVYLLTGLIDILVPWPLVSHWLKRNCPGYRGTRVLRHGKHNVCLSVPSESADQVVEWMNHARAG